MSLLCGCLSSKIASDDEEEIRVEKSKIETKQSVAIAANAETDVGLKVPEMSIEAEKIEIYNDQLTKETTKVTEITNFTNVSHTAEIQRVSNGISSLEKIQSHNIPEIKEILQDVPDGIVLLLRDLEIG
ncbi:hypothetical protein QYM36_019516 [Artemia franciscana]|uniref:Uncharacterized protein n=1 Tax=Artemia franciscana TaxID=6661 RepID=A0AA88H7S1_ARTSF|nr:hypothetical protein QYM36_019516 [Artemia franciscana]